MAALILLVALLPVALLVYYIRHKDRNNPEPTSQLLKAFACGILSVLPALLIYLMLKLAGLVPEQTQNLWDALKTAFFAAAIPEELAKLAMLWFVLRRNRYFDENMDGIVYAVCVSLGFAAFENILYLFDNGDTYLQVGLRRALFAIPGHFCFGVLMGYYYSLVRFDPRARARHLACMLLAPIGAHGVYDALLFAADVSATLSTVLSLVFILFCHFMWRFASRRIEWHLEADGIITR